MIETPFATTYNSLEGVVGPPRISFIPHNVSARMVMPLQKATLHKKHYCKNCDDPTVPVEELQ